MSTRDNFLASTALTGASKVQSQPARPEGLRHLNQEQLARRWQVSPRTLERHRWLGVGVPYLKLHGRVAYRLQDIEVYEAHRLKGGR